jgi:hypothetical protein
MDLRYPLLSATAALCASLDPLDVVRLSLILVILNPGIADSLLTVSMFTVKCHLDLAKILAAHIVKVEY